MPSKFGHILEIPAIVKRTKPKKIDALHTVRE